MKEAEGGGVHLEGVHQAAQVTVLLTGGSQEEGREGQPGGGGRGHSTPNGGQPGGGGGGHSTPNEGQPGGGGGGAVRYSAVCPGHCTPNSQQQPTVCVWGGGRE